MPVNKNKKKGLKVDFSGVEGRVLLPEGDYHVRVEVVEQEESSNGNSYLKWTFRTIDDDPKLNNKPLWYNTSLLPQALWNLRNLLETLGVDIEDDMELDLDSYADLECIVSVEHEKYEGKQRAKVTDFQPLVEDSDAKKVMKETADDEGEDESEEEDPAEAEEDEEAEEEAEEGDGEEEEVAEKEGYSREELKDMDQDELSDIVKKHKLKIRDGLTAKKRRAAIIAALEEEELVTD